MKYALTLRLCSHYLPLHAEKKEIRTLADLITNPIVFSFIIILAPFLLNAQDSTLTSKIEEEGKHIFRLEAAAWNGSEILTTRFANRVQHVGGYFAYLHEQKTRVVFFSKGIESVAMLSMDFDTTFSTETADVSLNQRNFSPAEEEIYILRNIALKIINEDSLFKVYSNTNLNIIPIISKDEKKVYVLTGPQKNGVVIFGNDYLISFNERNEVIDKKQLHANILQIEFGGQEAAGREVVASMHSHTDETGDYITSTDIATLLLYAKFAKWKQHYVMSKNYVSIWNCDKQQLTVLTQDSWKRIFSDNKKNRRRKK